MEATADGNAVDWFVDRHLREGRGNAPAFIDPWRALSYADLATDTCRFAGAFTLSPALRAVIDASGAVADLGHDDVVLS